MKNSTRFTYAVMALIVFFLSFISFTLLWHSTDEMDYIGFSMIPYFISGISAGENAGIGIVMAIASITLLLASIGGMAVNGYKIWKMHKDENFINQKIEKIGSILLTAAFPGIALIYVITIPDSTQWAYKFFLFFPMIFTLFILAANTLDEIQEITDHGQNDILFQNYGTRRSVFMQKVIPVIIPSIVFFLHLAGVLDSEEPSVLSIVALVLAGVMAAGFAVLLQLFSAEAVKKSDLLQHIALPFSLLIMIITALSADYQGALFSFKYYAYAFSILNTVFAIYYFKNVKLRFYLSWPVIIFIVLFTLILV